MSGYALENGGTQHVIYRGEDEHVHELRWTSGSGWHHHDQTLVAGGPYTVDLPAACALGGRRHPARVLPQRRWTRAPAQADAASSWHHQDVTTSIVASSTPAPPAVSGPAAYTYEPQGTVHVIYRGGDGHVHELYNGGYWVHVDLALQAQAPDIVGDPAGTRSTTRAPSTSYTGAPTDI